MFRQRLFCSLVALCLCVSPVARAEDMKLFIKSCTYGVLAGTLVGAASLAFTSQPGENLNNIARGASLGLYTGILIGYLAVKTPGEDKPEENPEERPEGGEDEGVHRWVPSLGPLVGQRGLEGAQVGLGFRF